MADTAKLPTGVQITLELAWRWTGAVARTEFKDSTPVTLPSHSSLPECHEVSRYARAAISVPVFTKLSFFGQFLQRTLQGVRKIRQTA